MDPDGMGGEGFPPSLANASSPSSTTSNPTGGVDSTHPVPVILRISPANAGDMAGYIHLSYNEIIHRSAVVAYFDSAGREVEVIPCPDFDAFLADHSLRTRNVSFLLDLPDYILESGRRILVDNDHSSGNVRPDLSWLPTSPSPPSAPSTSSWSLLSLRPTNLPSHANVTTRARFRPDPDGIEALNAPLSFAMEGHGSVGNFSPLTTSDVLSFRSIQGSSTPRGYILTQQGSSLTAQRGSSTSFHPSSGASVMSSIVGSMIPASSASSDSATTVAPSPPPAQQRAVRVHDPAGPDAGQPLERIDVLGVHPQEGLASVQVRQKIMRRRGLDGPGMERAREFEERTRVVAERLDVEEIFRTRETEFLFRGGGEGVVDCDCDCD